MTIDEKGRRRDRQVSRVVLVEAHLAHAVELALNGECVGIYASLSDAYRAFALFDDSSRSPPHPDAPYSSANGDLCGVPRRPTSHDTLPESDSRQLRGGADEIYGQGATRRARSP